MNEEEQQERLVRIEELANQLWNLTEPEELKKGCTRGLPGHLGPSSEDDGWTPRRGLLDGIEEALKGAVFHLSMTTDKPEPPPDRLVKESHTPDPRFPPYGLTRRDYKPPPPTPDPGAGKILAVDKELDGETIIGLLVFAFGIIIGTLIGTLL
jgi:hypothetical protein